MNKILTFIIVIMALIVPVISAGCLENQPVRSKLKELLLPYVEDIVVGFTIHIVVELDINVSQDYFINSEDTFTGQDTTYRDYTITARVSATTTAEGSNILTPIVSQETTNPRLLKWVKPDGTMGYSRWDQSVKFWAGQRWSSDGTPNITTQGTDPAEPGTGDHLVPKPSKYLTLAGFSFNIDEAINTITEETQIPINFRMSLSQAGESIMEVQELLFATIGAKGAFEDAVYSFDYYVPVGGRVVSHLPIDIDFYQSTQTWSIGWNTSYLQLPDWAWLLVPWVGTTIWAFNTITSLFGLDCQIELFRLDIRTQHFAYPKGGQNVLTQLTNRISIELEPEE